MRRIVTCGLVIAVRCRSRRQAARALGPRFRDGDGDGDAARASTWEPESRASRRRSQASPRTTLRCARATPPTTARTSSRSKSPTSTPRTPARTSPATRTSTATATAGGTASSSVAAPTRRGSLRWWPTRSPRAAIAVSNGKRTIVVEVLDNEGVFDVYQARIRAKVAADGYRTDGIFISATHDESAPGRDRHLRRQPTDVGRRRVLHRLHGGRPPRGRSKEHCGTAAHIRFAEALEPANLRQCGRRIRSSTTSSCRPCRPLA